MNKHVLFDLEFVYLFISIREVTLSWALPQRAASFIFTHVIIIIIIRHYAKTGPAVEQRPEWTIVNHSKVCNVLLVLMFSIFFFIKEINYINSTTNR